MVCYRDGGCGPYEMYSCNECPASKPDYKKEKGYPPYLDYPKERKKQTNADKYFRNATDEELAERLLRMDTICRGAMDGKMPCKNDQYGISCKDCWLDWLKQEVESDV